MSKTVHEFECREDIWKRVEALAKRRGVTTDEIIQAALIQLFTRKKGEAAADAGTSPVVSAQTPKPAPAPSRPSATPPGPSASATPVPSAAPSGPPPPRPGLPKPPGPPGGSRLPPPSRMPTQGVPGAAPASAAPAKNRPLFLFFEGNWYTIDQDQFVIGRGSKFSDLPIKDANISRRHASVVRRGHDYFIKDLGSTNGIEFEGQRVDNHKVNDGSVYFLCDHELRFTFTPPNPAG